MKIKNSSWPFYISEILTPGRKTMGFINNKPGNISSRNSSLSIVGDCKDSGERIFLDFDPISVSMKVIRFIF
jgi:hypothetical protein